MAILRKKAVQQVLKSALQEATASRARLQNNATALWSISLFAILRLLAQHSRVMSIYKHLMGPEPYLPGRKLYKPISQLNPMTSQYHSRGKKVSKGKT